MLEESLKQLKEHKKQLLALAMAVIMVGSFAKASSKKNLLNSTRVFTDEDGEKYFFIFVDKDCPLYKANIKNHYHMYNVYNHQYYTDSEACLYFSRQTPFATNFELSTSTIQYSLPSESIKNYLTDDEKNMIILSDKQIAHIFDRIRNDYSRNLKR